MNPLDFLTTQDLEHIARKSDNQVLHLMVAREIADRESAVGLMHNDTQQRLLFARPRKKYYNSL